MLYRMVILTDKLVFNQQITFYQSECQNRSFYKVRFAEIILKVISEGRFKIYNSI